MVLSSVNVDKHEFLSEDVLSGKKPFRKSCYNQKNWILTIKQWVENVNWHWKKRYQVLGKVYKFDKKDNEIRNRKEKLSVFMNNMRVKNLIAFFLGENIHFSMVLSKLK